MYVTQNFYNIKENQGFYDSTVTNITHISFTNNDMAINCQMTAYKIPEVNVIHLHQHADCSYI
jgi:hypothetical protein